MIPYLSHRESSPILAMVKPPVEKWTPKPGEEIEVSNSLSGRRERRKFIEMRGDIYVCVNQCDPCGRVSWRCAWPIKRMSGPDMTPPPDPYPGMVILKGPSIGNIALPVTPAAADPDGWVEFGGTAVFGLPFGYECQVKYCSSYPKKIIAYKVLA